MVAKPPKVNATPSIAALMPTTINNACIILLFSKT